MDNISNYISKISMKKIYDSFFFFFFVTKYLFSTKNNFPLYNSPDSGKVTASALTSYHFKHRIDFHRTAHRQDTAH